MDRNKNFNRIRAGQLAAERFKQQLVSGQAAVLDRFGIPIRENDLIVWKPPHDLIFRVVKSEALVSLDPRQPVPPGMIQLTVVVDPFAMNLIGNNPQMAIIHCGSVPTESQVMGNGAEKPLEDPADPDRPTADHDEMRATGEGMPDGDPGDGEPHG